MLGGLGENLTDRRVRAMLSLCYDTGLHTSELVAVAVGDLELAIDAYARLLRSREHGDNC